VILALLPHQSIWKITGAISSIGFGPFKKLSSRKEHENVMAY